MSFRKPISELLKAQGQGTFTVVGRCFSLLNLDPPWPACDMRALGSKPVLPVRRANLQKQRPTVDGQNPFRTAKEALAFHDSPVNARKQSLPIPRSPLDLTNYLRPERGGKGALTKKGPRGSWIPMDSKWCDRYAGLAVASKNPRLALRYAGASPPAQESPEPRGPGEARSSMSQPRHLSSVMLLPSD